MKMSLQLVKPTYDWDADSTDLDETELSDSPNRVYQDTAANKMERCALKHKGSIKWSDKEEFLESISVRVMKDKNSKISNSPTYKLDDTTRLLPLRKFQKEKSLQLQNEDLWVPMSSLKSTGNSVAEDIRYLLGELVKNRHSSEKPKESRMLRIETIHEVLPASE